MTNVYIVVRFGEDPVGCAILTDLCTDLAICVAMACVEAFNVEWWSKLGTSTMSLALVNECDVSATLETVA